MTTRRATARMTLVRQMRAAVWIASALLVLALPAAAQAPARIAIIFPPDAASSATRLASFKQGMRENGLLEGKHYVIDARYAEGNYERFPAITDELLKRNPAVIMVSTIASVRVAQRATKTIPIVFASTNDPVGSGLVASLARPGGNTTGLATQGEDIIPKHVELIHEALPRATRFGVLVNPRNPSGPQLFGRIQAAAAALGITARAFEASSPEALDATFAAIAQHRPDALLMIGDYMFFDQRARISEFALKQRIPHFGGAPEYAASGSFMSYGTSPPAMFRRAGIYVKKILAGTKPADLPVEQPTIFELVVNLKTARALGITVPPIVMLRADRVIE